MAKLTIPGLNTQLNIVEGDDKERIAPRAGHVADSMPGKRGNCIIARHRDTHFRALKDIRKGNDILVQADDGQFLYRVNAASVVSPSDTRALPPTSGAVLNLITCYPFYYVDSAPKRFVVEARGQGRRLSGKAK